MRKVLLSKYSHVDDQGTNHYPQLKGGKFFFQNLGPFLLQREEWEKKQDFGIGMGISVLYPPLVDKIGWKWGSLWQQTHVKKRDNSTDAGGSNIAGHRVGRKCAYVIS